MCVFILLREVMAGSKELTRKLSLRLRIQSFFGGPSPQHSLLSTYSVAIRPLMDPKEASKKNIGFHLREKRASYGSR